MKKLSRATALKIAAVLSILISLTSIVFSLPMIASGAAAVEQSGEAPPFVVVMLSLLTGVVGLVAAYGTWNQQRWGIVLTILVNLLNGLSAAPGILFAPTTELFIAATLTVILTIAIIVLCLWRDGVTATA